MASIINRSSRSRRTPIRKRPSEASMFSVVTHNSNGSNGSNTTVTPESVAKAKHQPSRPVASRRTATTRPSKKKASQSAPSMPSVEERPNVFEFMVEDEEEGVRRSHAVELDGAHVESTQFLRTRTASVSSSSSAERTYYTRPKFTYDDQHYHWHSQGFPSGSSFTDSGISVRSSSPERDSSILRHEPLNPPPDRGKCNEVEHNLSDDATDRYLTGSRVLGLFDGGPETSPEAFYSLASRPSFQDHELNTAIHDLPSHRSNCVTNNMQDEDSATSQDSVGFVGNRLASHVSSNHAAALRPIYRKFKSLNDRALLHLQGEISGLETQLENVDKAFAETSKSSDRGARAAEVDSDTLRRLRWHRAELMRQILTNLERYNGALASYSRLSKHVDAASETDICAYKEWIDKDSSYMVVPEAFHNHDEDLVTIASRRNFKPTGSEKSVVATSSAVLMVIIAFRITPQLFSRLVIGTVIGLVMSCSGVPPTRIDLNCLREYGKRTLVYGCLMVVLAVSVG